MGLAELQDGLGRTGGLIHFRFTDSLCFYLNDAKNIRKLRVREIPSAMRQCLFRPQLHDRLSSFLSKKFRAPHFTEFQIFAGVGCFILDFADSETRAIRFLNKSQ
jgi:hypothetical protein